MAEILKADRAHAFLWWVLLSLALALTLAAVSLVLHLWRNGAAGLVQSLAIAAVPVLIAWTIVSLRPQHAYTQRPFLILKDLVGP